MQIDNGYLTYERKWRPRHRYRAQVSFCLCGMFLLYPRASAFSYDFHPGLRGAAELSSFVVIGTVVDTAAIQLEGSTRVYTDYTIDVDEFLAGEPTVDSTLTCRAIGGRIGDVGSIDWHAIRPELGPQYLLFLTTYPGSDVPMLDFDKHMARIVGDSAYMWPDTALTVSTYLGYVEQHLQVRSPAWQSQHEDLAIHGTVVDCDVRQANYGGDQTGTLRIINEDILLNRVSFESDQGDTLSIAIRPYQWLIPDFTPGKEVVVFASLEGTEIQLANSIWSSWFVVDDSISVSIGSDGATATIARLVWSEFVNLID